MAEVVGFQHCQLITLPFVVRSQAGSFGRMSDSSKEEDEKDEREHRLLR